MTGVVENCGQRLAIAARRLQTSMHAFNVVLFEPRDDIGASRDIV
jgi:hypothetical protein